MKKAVLSVFCLIIFSAIFVGCRPYISGTTPEDGAIEVPGHAKIEARFGIRIEDSTFVPSMYYLELDGKPVVGNSKLEVRLTQDVLVFTPVEPLKAGKTYKATVKAGMRSEDDGSAMLSDKVFSFTIDTVKPEFVSIDPADGATDFYRTRITITFNEPIGDIDYVLKDSTGTIVNCMATPIDNTVQIKPPVFNNGTTYTLQVFNYSDTAGNINNTGFSSRFTTQKY